MLAVLRAQQSRRYFFTHPYSRALVRRVRLEGAFRLHVAAASGGPGPTPSPSPSSSSSSTTTTTTTTTPPSLPSPRTAVRRVHPLVREFASYLVGRAPSFVVPARAVVILHEPAQFWRYLLDMIGRAKRRVFLSSLYIGSAKQELIDALHAALERHPALTVTIVLDERRSTRPGDPASASASASASPATVDVLAPLLLRHPERVRVALFRSPKLHGALARLVPRRLDEGWGTWHAKVYGADDDVVISGANLNRSYFTNRQDRYVCFEGQPHLAQYCLAFLDAVSHFSFRMVPRASSSPSSPSSSPLSSSDPPPYTIEWPHAQTPPHDIHDLAHRLLASLQTPSLSATPCDAGAAADRRECAADRDDNDSDNEVALVVPVIQADQFGIREEEAYLTFLFECLALQPRPASARPLIDLTSGYFGLYARYRDLILTSPADCRIVAASPEANGFYGSGDLSGLIPEGYTLLEQRFMRAVKATGRCWHDGGGVQLSEWRRDGWTYHAKGLWLSPGAAPTTATATTAAAGLAGTAHGAADESGAPVLTLFGSTNLNSRSAQLDLELSFFLLPASPPPSSSPSSPSPLGSRRPHPTLRARLRDEVDALRAWAVPWRGEARRVRLRTRALVALVGDML